VVTPVPPPLPAYDDEDDDRGGRPGLLVFLALLLVLVIGLAAFLLPKMFESPNNQVQVPNVVGMTNTKARAALGDAGLSVTTPSYAHDNTVGRNRVIKQSPGAGQYVDSGSDVTFTLSLGLQPATVPYLTGQTRQQAAAALNAVNLKAAFHMTKSDQPQGTVIRTSPDANQSVPQGSTVNVFVSKGPSKVPDVVGMQQGAAEQTLKNHGFVPAVKPDDSSTKPQGTVTQEVPDAGQTASQGSTVYIFVSTYVPPTESPTTPTTAPTTLPTTLPTTIGPSVGPSPGPTG
jgi:serine/threonine-protein kinase